MTRVQICGITTAGDALMCEETGADALGFVSVPGRKRSLTLEQIRDIAGQLGPFTARTLIDFSEKSDEIIRRAEFVNANIVQVYAPDKEELEKIRESGLSVVRAVTVDVGTKRPEISYEKLREISEACDCVLFEPSLGGKTGGMGLRHDYETLSAAIGCCRRFGIAGGLNSGNVGRALELKPHMVDVSSGVESETGKKDREKVREFVARCRGHE